MHNVHKGACFGGSLKSDSDHEPSREIAQLNDYNMLRNATQ